LDALEEYEMRYPLQSFNEEEWDQFEFELDNEKIKMIANIFVEKNSVWLFDDKYICVRVDEAKEKVNQAYNDVGSYVMADEAKTRVK